MNVMLFFLRLLIEIECSWFNLNKKSHFICKEELNNCDKRGWENRRREVEERREKNNI